MDKKTILIFGVGELQKSMIQKAKGMGLFTVGIDPSPEAFCKDEVDAFEIVGGQDFENTLAVARKYNVSAIITAATDKPLVMMARIAKELNLKFYSEQTARISTDKFLMKQCFEVNGISCAKGKLISSVDEAEGFHFPVIAKPRDNSGSRGVVLCNSKEELAIAITEALSYSNKKTILVEEFIEGQEYSIESLHFNGRNEVIQFTEKSTTPFPYNVELGHKQPANLNEQQKLAICRIIEQIGKCLHFENCASHTELKINDRGIFIIETSPRLGGDYITSLLTPLSAGINLEEQLLHISLGEKVDIKTNHPEKASGIVFFDFPCGNVNKLDLRLKEVKKWPNVIHFNLKLKEGDVVNRITSSLNRYGELVVVADNYELLTLILEKYKKQINQMVEIDLKN